MSIMLSKKDVFWSYLAQFFMIASGVLTLPLILKLLSPEEIGLNYLMLTIGSLVSLFDFGFAPHFGQNITYIFSGAQSLKKEGIDEQFNKNEINFKLLATMIQTGKFIYRKLSFLVLFFMLTFGSLYIYNVSKGFTVVNNLLEIWIVYCISIFFNIYYAYYNTLLVGKGMIMESRKALVLSKITYIFLTFIFLFAGMGLLGIVLANLISPFVNRFLSYKAFFTAELQNEINTYVITTKEKKQLFEIIWFNAKKLGFISFASSSLSYLTVFIIGLFLSLSEVASYGLMIQLTGIVATISSTLFIASLPKMAFLYLQNEIPSFKKYLSISLVSFYILFFVGSILLIFFVPMMLDLFKSKAILPPNLILTAFLFFTLFEKNQSLFSQILLFDNKIPFLRASLITGLISVICVYGGLMLGFGFVAVVLAQGIPTLAYSAWKWPMVILRKFNFTFFNDIALNGIVESKQIIIKQFNG